MQDDSMQNSTTTTTDAASTDTTTDTTTTTTAPADDLATLFAPEEVTAKREAVAATKAEETRRAALTDEERTAEDKTAADAKTAEEAAKAIPEKYEFKTPEGMELDAELLAETEPLFKELGLTQEKAQQVIDLYTQKVLPAVEKQKLGQWNAITDGWQKEIKANKEIALGAEGNSTDGVRLINTLLNAEEAKRFKEEAKSYSFGANYSLNLLLARAATHFKEDGSFKPENSNSGATKGIAERMFPGLPLT